MGNFLYLLALLMIFVWGVAFWGFQAGALVHILLLVAIIAVFIEWIIGKDTV